MIRFTGYEVIAEKLCIGELGRFFVYPVGKTAVDRKMVETFNGLDVVYHHAKFGEDRAMHAGCRCENMVFVTIFLLCLSCSKVTLTL